jgi:hypothetical protein
MKATLVAVLVVLASALPMPAQIGRGSITGIVRDPSGAIIASAKVTATNIETSVNFETTTNDSGAYNISALPTGIYHLRVQAPGFKEFVKENITLEAGTIARIDPAFEIGGVTERVVVTEESAMLATETAQNSESVTSKIFSDLPLSFGGGRNMAAFADRLVPGVVRSVG